MWARVEKGTVISTGKWAETDVSSYGGGGYIDPQFGGRVKAAQIHSTVYENTELFVRRDDGKEESIRLVDIRVAFRQGSNISYAFGTIENSDRAPLIFISNDDTGEFHSLAVNYKAKKDSAATIVPMLVYTLLPAGFIFWIFFTFSLGWIGAAISIAYLYALDRFHDIGGFKEYYIKKNAEILKFADLFNSKCIEKGVKFRGNVTENNGIKTLRIGACQ